LNRPELFFVNELGIKVASLKSQEHYYSNSLFIAYL
jgi:hypothetical protein